MTRETTRIRLEDQRTILTATAADQVVLGVGARALGDRLFRRDLPTPAELEQAIDVVEDALAATGLRHADRGDLLTDDPLLHALLGLRADGERVSREEVEARFQRLASAALGQPGLLNDIPKGRTAAAALLIVRECLHHLGYAGVGRATTAPPLPPPAAPSPGRP